MQLALEGSLEHVLEQAPRTLKQPAERERSATAPDEGAARRVRNSAFGYEQAATLAALLDEAV